MLSDAVQILQTSKGAEKNLLLKKFIKEIKYSQEKIEIAFYYPNTQKGPEIKKIQAGSVSKMNRNKKQDVKDASMGSANRRESQSVTGGLGRPTATGSVRNRTYCGESNPPANWFTIIFPNTIDKRAKIK